MVTVASLVVPILVSAVVVFFTSFVIHMVLPYHRSDYRKLPDPQEDQILEAVRRLNLSPAEYCVPHPGSHDRMKDPAFVAKMTKGPIIFMNVSPGTAPALAKPLLLA